MYSYIIIITSCCLLGLIWALLNTKSIFDIKINGNYFNRYNSLIAYDKLYLISNIGEKISKGANAFLYQEYTIMSYFIIVFSFIIFIFVDYYGSEDKQIRFYATFCFIIGSLTSMISGYVGMKIAVKSNYRTTYMATFSLESAFELAFRAGCVMGFFTVSFALLTLLSIILIYYYIFQPISMDQYSILMEWIAAFGLGGSAMALFGRVGGGIYTKAADVGADLVGKVEEGLNEDSPRNPATIADNVGDNVGDIAGMGSDLFGSFAESTCACLVVISNNKDLMGNPDILYLPLVIFSVGIISCFLSSLFGIYIYKVDQINKVEKSLKLQLLLSTIFVLILLYPIKFMIPEHFIIDEREVYWYYIYLVVSLGLISGFFIGLSTDYYTSYANYPVREMARSCSSGAAINIIYGLSLGYMSTVIPILLLAFTILVSIKLLGILGISLSAIGMLSTLPICLAIDVYGPISDNAGGICEMSELGEEIRNYTDALDAAGNTTAAIGKGFAIGSAALVSIALYTAFITRIKKHHLYANLDIELINPWIFCSLFFGSMLPYAFSALTMKSVGYAAQEIVNEVREQFKNPDIRNGNIEPNYEKCITVSTNASLKEMILPGVLVICLPIFIGIFLSPVLLIGLLPGTLLSGVQLAISMSNTGGAWDNSKKYIESGELRVDNKVIGKGSDEHKAAVIGDTVGDPLKDTSGPSLNILIKLMSIISLVFVGGFINTSYLSKYIEII